jgi:UDP-N-acetylmuramoyl-L-alanyl-D-glutamate--2,6-diaminopimelate ligase
MEKFLHIIKKIIPVKLFKAVQPAYHFLLAWFSSVVYRHPSEKLIVIGVTGTTGKTTSVFLIAKMLAAAGHKVGYTSTAMFSDGAREWLNDKKMTMAGRFFTQEILHKMVRNGCRYAIVETTSEGVRQFRHRFINYDIIVFTGLYPEHIESHGSFEKYREAKGRLFAHLKKCKIKFTDDKGKVILGVSSLKKIELNRVKKTTILNLDDDQADYFANFWAEEKLGYGRTAGVDKEDTIKKMNRFVEYVDIESSSSGTSFKVQDADINLRLLGGFNAANAMNAVCLGLVRGLSLVMIKKGLEGIDGIPGRLEKIDEGQDFTVIVDYAFEPNALVKLYETVEGLPHDRVIHLLGSAGGGRDMARRPALGQIAGKHAQIVIITNEDPYDENPEIIIDQVALGAEKAGKKNGEDLFRILDRRAAINKALSEARTGDLVLITGKGSEQAICVADEKKIPWDDRQVVREELHKISYP